jgi:hypothetical protein
MSCNEGYKELRPFKRRDQFTGDTMKVVDFVGSCALALVMAGPATAQTVPNFYNNTLVKPDCVTNTTCVFTFR